MGLKTPLQTPRNFLERMDSASMGGMKVSEFFNDANLVALIDTALHRNQDIAMAFQRIEMARADLWKRGAALLPSVSAKASGGIHRYGKYTQEGVGNYDTNFSDNVIPDLPDQIGVGIPADMLRRRPDVHQAELELRA